MRAREKDKRREEFRQIDLDRREKERASEGERDRETEG